MRSYLAFAALAATAATQELTTSYSVASTALTTAYSSGASIIASSTTKLPVTHTVAAAKGGHSYDPDVIVAEPGDVVEFQFYPTNHSVIRAAYGYPCVPYEMIMGAGNYGFYSGSQPVDTVLADPPTWSLTVNDTDPVFFYCGAINSCIGWQMVGVINPNASTSLEVQKQKAKDSSFMLTPGMDWPDEGSIPSGVATTSYSTPSATAGGSTATSTAAPSSSHGLSSGAIAGIAIGGAAVLVIAGIAIWFCGRQSRKHAHAPPALAQETQYNQVPYAKPGHMSTVSGYSMPPGYADQSAMLSPHMQSGGFQDPRSMHSGSVSPNFMSSAPAYGHNAVEAYAPPPGTHRVAPVEMDAPLETPSREKSGVERYQ